MTSTAVATATPVSTMTLQPPAAQPLVLTPPEVVAIPQAKEAGQQLPPISAETSARIDERVEQFVDVLRTADLGSDTFRQALDSAFAAGREEVAKATRLNNSFTQGNLSTDVNSPAYKAIMEMREILDELNPSKQGDLHSPARILGILPNPWGNKIKRYVRKFQSAETNISKVHEGMRTAEDAVKRNVSDIQNTQQQVWGGLMVLQSAAEFLTRLNARLTADVEALRATDPMRARALEEEVLYYAGQNLSDVLATQALTITCYSMCSMLVKSGRDVVIATNRISTLGTSALSMGVVMARAIGEQADARKAAEQAKATIENLLTSMTSMMRDHVEQTIEFANNPILGVEKIQAMMNETFESMDLLADYRVKAVENMRTNNELVKGEVNRAMQRLEGERAAQSGQALASPAIPLSLDFTK